MGNGTIKNNLKPHDVLGNRFCTMGQYYKACVKSENGWNGIKSWDFFNGAKLMEHSYIGNNFVNALMSIIYQKPNQVVWAGDYADNEKDTDYNIYDICDIIEPKSIEEVKAPMRSFKYIVNHDKKQFVALSKMKKDKDGFRINPLPLLTAEGNSRGGCDYFGVDKEMVGIWARDLISVESTKPKDFEEIVCNFSTEWEKP